MELTCSLTENYWKHARNSFFTKSIIVVSLKEGMFNNANVIYRTKFIEMVFQLFTYYIVIYTFEHPIIHVYKTTNQKLEYSNYSIIAITTHTQPPITSYNKLFDGLGSIPIKRADSGLTSFLHDELSDLPDKFE